MQTLPRRLAFAAAATLTIAADVCATDFNSTIFFGDSLTDSGTFQSVVPPGAGKFTTNPGPIWSENVAAMFRRTAIPAVAGGTNYAVGGARITGLPGIPPAPPTDNATPIAIQISTYLAATGGRADPNALYSVWGGANDIFFIAGSPAMAQAYLTTTALEQVQQILRLQAAGARYILVPAIPDIGSTPFGQSQGPAGSAGLTQLSQLYNLALYQGLSVSGARVIPIDTFSLLREVLGNPTAFGIVNTTVPACGATSSLLCTSANFVTPTAAQTFFFADGVHPTTVTHRILSDFVIGVIEAPRQISILPETAVKTRTVHVDQIYTQLAQEAWLRAQSGTNVWATVNGQRVKFDSSGTSPDAQGDGAGVMVGADFRVVPTAVLGLAVGVGRINPEFGSDRGDYRQSEIAITGYGGWRSDGWFVNGTATYGVIDYDTWRRVPLGATARTAHGSTTGRNLSLGAAGGYDFTLGNVSTGPLLTWLWQDLRVDEFTEMNAGSIGLGFGKQERTSNVGAAGWRVAYAAGGWLPYARLTVDHDFNDQDRTIEARAIGNAPVGWDTPAFKPGRTWWTATVGVAGRLGVASAWNVGVQHVFDQDAATTTNVYANISTSF